MNLFGRTKIYSAHNVVYLNVVDEVNKALISHFKNVSEEDYLYKYVRGNQPILYRTKEIREEINNKIVENIASEIVSFKNGYFLTKPTFYVSRVEDNKQDKKLSKLNNFLYMSGKQDADNELVDWFHTVGLGVLYVESNDDKEQPFSVYSLDPRNSFVVYSSRAGESPLMGVHIVNVSDSEDDAKYIFDVYTKNETFTLSGGNAIDENNNKIPNTCAAYEVIEAKNNVLGEIPIVEYQYNSQRMGAFESVMPLLDAINQVESDRANGVEQFIQSLMVFYNCQLGVDDDGNPMTPSQIREYGAIFLKNVGQDKADLKILNEQLDQSQSQVFIDNMKNIVYDIAGVPFNSHNMSSDSSNVGAVYLRSGFATADVQARNTEDLFKKSNRIVDRIILKILEIKEILKIKPSTISIQFTRNEMDNPLVKTQAALNLKALGFSPELVLEKSGISNDPVGDVKKSAGFMEIAFGSGVDTTPNVENPQNENGEVSDGVVQTQEAAKTPTYNPTEGNGSVKDEGAKNGNKTWIEGYWQTRK